MKKAFLAGRVAKFEAQNESSPTSFKISAVDQLEQEGTPTPEPESYKRVRC